MKKASITKQPPHWARLPARRALHRHLAGALEHLASAAPTDVHRRTFLTQGAGVGLALGLPALLAGCGGGDGGGGFIGGGDGGGGGGGGLPPNKHLTTLFFNLSHESYAGKTYYLTGGGQRLALTPVADQPDVLRRARQTNAFLRAVDDTQITHQVENAVFASDSVTLCYVSAEIDPQAGTWSMSSVQLYIPIPLGGSTRAYAQARASATSGLLPLSAKRRMYGVEPARSEADLRDERVLLDAASHAATSVGMHPDLMSLEPNAAFTIHWKHIDQNIDVSVLANKLTQAQYGPATPQQTAGQPNATGWSTLKAVPGAGGVPLRNVHGKHAGRIQYQPSLHPDLRTLAAGAMNMITIGVKNDTLLGVDVTGLAPAGPADPPNPALLGAMWLRHDGLTRVDQSPGQSALDGASAAMVLKQQNGQNGYQIKPSITQSGTALKASLTLINYFLEYRGVFLQFLDANGKAIVLTTIAEYTAGTIVADHDKTSDTPTGMFVSVIGPVYTVLGIPTAPGFIQPAFNVPSVASTVRILSSTMSMQSNQAYEDIAPAAAGAVMTGIFSYGATTLLCASGAATLLPSLYAGVIQPALSTLTAEIISFISKAFNPNGSKLLNDVLKTAQFWETQAVLVAKILTTKFLVGPAVNKLVTWFIGAISEGVAEDSIPVAGEMMEAISIAVGAINLAETTAELALTPWTYIDDLVFTHDLSVTVLKDSGNPNSTPPDPGDSTFPKAATNYTVTVMFDDGTPQVQTFALTTPVPSTLPPVIFKGVPFGGKINVSVAFVQKATGPAQEDVMLGKGSTGLVPNADLSFAIEELQFPISATTVYQHRQKTTLDASGNHLWSAGLAPTANQGNTTCGGAGTVCGFRGISVRQGSGGTRNYLGYAWQGQNSDPSKLPSCVGGGVGQLDQMGNLNADSGNGGANAQLGYANGGCGIGSPGVRVAYSLLGTGAANFYLDTSRPATPTVRLVTLEPTPVFASPLSNQAWGVLNFSSDALLLHPAGHLVSINSASHKLETHRIPLAAMADADAQVKLVAQIQSGKGSRPGLLDSPVAAAISPDGAILVLEEGNNRIQAFDLGGNAVRHFTQTSPTASPYSLTLGGTDPVQGWKYLDLAVEYTGYLYVLSYNENTYVYRLDIYHPKQASNQPISTTLNVNAARLTVDFWRSVYTLNYEVLRLPGGAAAGLTEPSVSLWTPCASGQTC